MLQEIEIGSPLREGDQSWAWSELDSTQVDESPNWELEAVQINDNSMITKLMNENAKYLDDRSGRADTGVDHVWPSPSPSCKSGTSLCEIDSASKYEMYDSCVFREMRTSVSSQRQESPELLDPINSQSGRRSLLQKIHETPAVDPHKTTPLHAINNRPSTHGLGSMISTTDRKHPKFHSLQKLSSTTSPSGRSEGGEKDLEIRVPTDIPRRSGNSFGASTESPCVATRMSSSLSRQASLEQKEKLPQLLPRTSLNLNAPLPPIPNSYLIQMSPLETNPSKHSSVMDGVDRFLSRASVSCSDSDIMECSPTDTWPHDASRDSHSRCRPSLETLTLADLEIVSDRVRAGNTWPDDLNRPEEPTSSCPIWNSSSPDTFAQNTDSPVSNFVSPISSNNGLSPLRAIYPTISPAAESELPPPDAVVPVTATDEGLYLGFLKHTGGLSSSEPVTKELEHSRVVFNTSDLGLTKQCLVLQETVSMESGAQWTNDSMPKWQSHLHRSQFGELNAQLVCAQPYPSIMASGNLADSIYPGGIGESLESEVPTSIMAAVAQDDASNLPSTSSYAPVQNSYIDPSFMDESVETVRADVPVDVNVGNGAVYELPLSIGGSDSYSSSSLPYSSEPQNTVAMSSGWHMNIPQLPLSGSHIFSTEDESDEAFPDLGNSKITPKSPNLSRTLLQSQSDEKQRASDKATDLGIGGSALHRRANLPNALIPPSSPKILPHCFYHQSLLVTHTDSTQNLVKALRALVGEIHTLWMQRLTSVPELQLRCSVLQPRILFEKGVSTLKECICGRFARTFEDFFAFVHLAFAAAFFTHDQQKFCCADDFDDFWDPFYEDAILWQHAIPDENDKILFLSAMDRRWWLPESQQTPSFNGSIISRRPLKFGGKTDLLLLLRNSESLKSCVAFLESKSKNFP